MVNKKKQERRSQSIRMLVIYSLLVFAVIFIAICFRAYATIMDSKFDGQHRFILAIASKDDVSGVVSLEPVTSSLSVLKFSKVNKKVGLSDLDDAMGVIPDGYVRFGGDVDLDVGLPALFQSILFRWNSVDNNITIYDLMRFWLYASKTPSSSIDDISLDLDTDNRFIEDKLAVLFNDSVIASENVSIQIINGAGESGLGNRLAKVIYNLGGNVVSVGNSSKIEKKSVIRHYGEINYTVKRIQNLLLYKLENLNKKEIGDIVIVIGKDYKKGGLK